MQATDWLWFDGQRRVDQAELAHMCSLTWAELDELVEYGALVPLLDAAGAAREFNASCVPALREAARLRAHFDLDLFTVGLVLGYLQRIGQLEHQLRSLQAQLPPVPRSGEELQHPNAEGAENAQRTQKKYQE